MVFVHAKPLEEKFVAEGYGVQRFEVMYNDFVLVGPKSDPAKVGGSKDIVAALQKIKAAQAPFVSRGDKSGTHFAELELLEGGRRRHRQGQGALVPRYAAPAWARRSTPRRR